MDFKPFVMDTFGGILGAERDLWGALFGRCVAGCTPHTRGTELGTRGQRGGGPLIIGGMGATRGALGHTWRR